MADEIVIFITASSEDEAVKIASSLVQEHLVACANIVPKVRSLFFWHGGIQDEQESLLICKGRLFHMDRIIRRVKSLHSYTVPEIIALPIISGSSEYLEWVKEATSA